MVKLRHLAMHKMENVPDAIQQEVQELALEIGKRLYDLFEEKSPNIVLAALNFNHAASVFTCLVETEEEIKKGAELTAVALYKNIFYLWELKKGSGHETLD